MSTFRIDFEISIYVPTDNGFYTIKKMVQSCAGGKKLKELIKQFCSDALYYAEEMNGDEF